MSWRELEQLVSEAYRRQGYQVQETGQGGADGGIDLVLRRDGQVTLVQCKHWRTQRVGAPVVREQFGLQTHHQAAAVIIVTTGDFTPEAKAFAEGKSIELIGGPELLVLVQSVQRPSPTRVTDGFYPETTDGCKRVENFKSCLAVLRRILGLWNRSMYSNTSARAASSVGYTRTRIFLTATTCFRRRGSTRQARKRPRKRPLRSASAPTRAGLQEER